MKYSKTDKGNVTHQTVLRYFNNCVNALQLITELYEGINTTL